MPRPAPKYFGLAPAWMALLGATKRMPSAEATSPLPQMWAIGRASCAATIRVLAAAMVSGRMKFWLTQDSRARLSAGWSVRTRGSKPMLQACAISPPHRLVVKSSTRAWRSLTCVKASAKPERAATSSMTSGRSIFGRRAETADCRAMRLGGRSSLSSGLSTSSSRPFRRPASGRASGKRSAVRRSRLLRSAGLALGQHSARRRDEHVAPLQPGAKGFEDCEDVGAIVGNLAGTIEDMALPGRIEELGWRAGHASLGPIIHVTQIVQRRDHRLAGWCRLKGGSLQHGGEQRAHPSPVRSQFLIAPIVGLGDQAVDAGHGSFDIGPGDLLEQGIAPFANRYRVIFVGHDILAHVAQYDGRGVEIAQRAQPGFAVRLLRMREDVA